MVQTQVDDPGPTLRQERVALIVLLVVLALALFAERWMARDETLASEAARLRGQATAARDVLAQQLRSVRSALLVLADQRVADERLGLAVGTMPGVTEVLLLDVDGGVRAASRAIAPRETVTGLPRAAAGDRLHLLAPAADTGGRWRMLVAVPLAGGGWLAAAIDPDYARVVQRSVRYAPDMRTVLAHGGGRLVMGDPPIRGLQTVDLNRPQTVFARHLASGGDVSVLRGDSTITGDARLFVLLSLRAPEQPVEGELVLTVSRSTRQVLATWRQQTAMNAALYLLLVVVSSSGMALMHRRERQALERERLEAERLQLVVQGADLVVWDVDLLTGRVRVNPRWNEMMGLPQASLEHDQGLWLARVHPEDLPAVLATRDRHFAGDEPHFESVYRLRREDGVYVWVLARGGVTVRGPDGRPLRMTGTLLDISERMQAQRALERSEQRLAVTLQSLGDGVVATDRDCRVAQMNSAAERLTGWSEHEARGRPLDEVLPLLDQKTGGPIASPVQAVLADGRVVELANDTVLVRRDGQRRFIEDSAAPIRGVDGVVEGVVMVFRDISERYEARRALRERERLLADITDAMPGPVARMDLQGRYRFANAAYRDWFGVDPATLVGRDMREVLGESSYALLVPQLARCAPGRRRASRSR
ncbi:MAG: PAS domain S-box protein [Comamonadaceae bacterium]|nr:PAS domain S-box protein [Comamonadaceae bacterium]